MIQRQNHGGTNASEPYSRLLQRARGQAFGTATVTLGPQQSPACILTRTMICGCTPSSINGFASRSISAASRVTVVVPSPISASCARAMSTSIFAAGCTMSSSCRILAPSFDMVACAGERRRTRERNIKECRVTALHSIAVENSSRAEGRRRPSVPHAHLAPVMDELVHSSRT